jgi:hypothetical protein
VSHRAHRAGATSNTASGSSASFRDDDGEPSCFPGFRPDLVRDDRFFAGFLSHAQPRTADATTLRNPTPAGVSAPRSDPPAQPQHAAAQPIHPANPQGTHPQATGNPAPEDHLRRASRRRPGLPQLNSYLFSPYPFRVQVSHRIQRYTHQSLPAQRGIQPSASWRRRVFQDVGHSGKPSGAERTWTPGGSPKDTVADATAHGECCPDGDPGERRRSPRSPRPGRGPPAYRRPGGSRVTVGRPRSCMIMFSRQRATAPVRAAY